LRGQYTVGALWDRQRAVFEFETIFDKSHFDEDVNGDYEDVDWDEYEGEYVEEGDADNEPED